MPVRLFLPLFLSGLICTWQTALMQAPHSSSFQSGERTVSYEVFDGPSASGPVLVLLPGVSGPESPFYRSQASFFATNGYTALLLHYFDAAKSRAPSDSTYAAWAAALSDLTRSLQAEPRYAGRPVFILGYSLGASVALAAGSQNMKVNGIAEWYGSLPDAFFMRLAGMPPLLILHGARDSNIPVVNAEQLIRLCQLKHFDCESHIYPDQNHGFTDRSLADAEERTLAFFKKHLQPSSAVPPPNP